MCSGRWRARRPGPLRRESDVGRRFVMAPSVPFRSRFCRARAKVAGTLFEYAVQVLDALGIQYGPCHFELMWTDQGVRLVEVGARVHGAPQTHGRLNRMCTGVSQVDQTIDLYLDPARFLRDARTSYKLRWEGMMCRLIPWREGVFRGFHGLERIERMRSFHRSFGMAEPGERVPGCFRGCDASSSR